MKRILLPTDFSPHAEAALSHAVRFADAFGAELHLLNVQVPYGPTSPLIDEFPGETGARKALDGLEVGNTRVVREVRRGVATAPTILDYAEDNDVDLIVMGSHGRRGVPRLWLGSVAEEVIRPSRCPVLTTHAEADGQMGHPRYRKILVPVDFSARTPGQLETAAELARTLGSDLDIVHVIDLPTLPDLYIPVASLAVDMKGTTEKALARLKELAHPLRDDLTVTTDLLVGRAVHEIVKRAHQGADLIVMPTHGYSGLERVLLGSVAEGVLRRSRSPVMVLNSNNEGQDETRERSCGSLYAVGAETASDRV